MAETPSRPSREPLLFAAACVVAALAFLGTRGLWETDEGRYAECARKMLATGEWLVPMRHGAPHLTKPPGAYWLSAAGMALVGVNAWGARLFVGVAFAATAACVRTIGKGLFGPAAGARAGWVYLTMLYPFAMGSILTTDTHLAALLAACCAAGVAALSASRPGMLLAASGIALAGALFVKGPPALLPWAGFVAGWAVAGRRAFPGRKVVSAAGLLLAFGLGAAWFVWADRNVPGAHEHFTGRELNRLSSPGDHEPRPLWFYPGILIAGLTPWWAAFVRGVRQAGLSPAGRWLLVWAGAAFVVFQVAASKNWAYVLPIAVPLAVWAGVWARDPASPWPVRPWLLGVWLALLCGGRLAVDLTVRDDDRRDVRPVAERILEIDPDLRTEVRTLAGRDLDGLEFYLGGRMRRVESPGFIDASGADAELREEADALARAGAPWVLVAEDSRAARICIQKALRGTARPAGKVRGWLLYRVVPPPARKPE